MALFYHFYDLHGLFFQVFIVKYNNYDTNYLSRFYLYDMIKVECMRKLKLGNQGVIYYAR